MNPKEQFFSALQNGKPIQWMGYAFNAFPPFFPMVIDPVTELDSAFRGARYIDHWGATWRHLDTDPGAIPMVSQDNAVIKDLEHWRDYVNFPSLAGLDWSAAKKQIAELDRETTFVMIPSFYGPFERAHTLLTFEDVLVNMYTEPELMYELFEALTDWKIKAVDMVIDELKPDIIHSHDDWGDRTRLFFSPKVFRKLLKPHYKRLYDFIKSRGVLVQHHCDGFAQGLEMDMLDMGIDMWQGVIPQNDIPAIQKNTQGKMLLLGGIDQTLFDSAEPDEEKARAEVRRAIDAYAPGGAYLPCITSVVCVNPDAQMIAVDEMNRYGEEWLEKNSENK